VIIACDPGKVTGIATYWSGSVSSMQEPTWYAIDRIWAMLGAPSMPVSTIVCEAYVVTAATLRKTRQYDALESIGALRWMANKHHIEFVLQTPADAKRFADDAKLKAAGWYFPTPGGHANDAARHLMLYLARNDVELFKRVIAG
jgi:hypothetical protein